MTKKHFQALADALKNCKPVDSGCECGQENSKAYRTWEETCASVSAMCGDANPRFDRARFLKACGVEE